MDWCLLGWDEHSPLLQGTLMLEQRVADKSLQEFIAESQVVVSLAASCACLSSAASMYTAAWAHGHYLGDQLPCILAKLLPST